ncbi:MAG: tyrosine-type recombinase/integrase, partial [Actinomycetes bacterium]
KDAERAQVELLARLDRGGYVDPTKVTLAAYLDRWLDHMASIGRDERTVERYGELLRLHVTPHLGGLRLQQLAPMHLSDLYAKLLREGRRDGRPGGLSARSVLHVHRALLAAAEGWQHTLVLLGLATGARLGELLALRWTDVDLQVGTVRIGRSLRVVGRRLQVKGPKTEAGYRTVALGPTVAAALRRLRAEQVERRLVLGAEYDAAADLVICKPAGGPYRPDSASTMFRALVRRAGLPDTIHVHTLRHSAASFLAAAGVPASDIAAQLGHADGGALALRIYVHPLAEGLTRAAAHLDRVIGGGQ